MSIFNYLIKTYPNNRFTLQGNNYSSLEWYEDNPSPKPSEQEFLNNLNYVAESLSEEQIQTQILEAQKLAYIGKRQNEYPSIIDQLDTLYHGGYDAWKEQIQAVKDKYPKPN
jgi:hypothetical protein